MTKLNEWLKRATVLLNHISDTPRLDAELLACYCLQKERVYLYTYGDDNLDDTTLKKLNMSLSERQTGKPIAYITGKKSFWSLNLTVSEDTLIPRPETEILVEQALHYLSTYDAPTVFDLGTGSGAIALAIAKERPDATLIASDISDKALEVAKKNAQDANVHNITFIQSNWFDSLPKLTPILIVSNPPYIDQHSPQLELSVKTFEPRIALISPNKGLADIEHLIQESRHILAADGMLLMEFGQGQHPAIHEMLQQHLYQSINFYTDLQHITRSVSAIRHK